MGNVTVTSNRMRIINVTEKALKTAARMIGGSLEGHAKELCPVDTGLLRNSITFALGGEAPNITQYSSDQDGKREKKTGAYDGTAEADEDHEITVYLGTNVEYAPYQELGAPNIHLDARPFLRPAMENNKREILQIIEKQLKEMR